ncbi:uncharacterized protein LOC131525908 isoform X1 [Onychostoma macrolepis]|uniref:uncharacterized protein LOC131525908 isoform X1 n=1 Tax=Onychostoma macrolepis TaxID=369639 RepID=UPI00272BE2A8|nr:uncharacterized protein LOC131525908 isoform X1 [Onychostoma macrolepis]
MVNFHPVQIKCSLHVSHDTSVFRFSLFWKHLLLLFCIVIYSETTSIHVPGKKGGSATLPCEFEDRDIFDVILKSLSKDIPVCKTEECNGRVFKIGACDVVIKDLRLSDAGKYILRVFYRNDQAELDRQTREYHLHIDVEISVKTGEELKLDVLLTNTDKVETNSSGEWREVWNRRDGVLDHHLTDTDGNLTIKGFTANDTGTYRVLDSDGEILITVTVTGSSTESKEKLNKTDGSKNMIIGLSVCGLLVFLAFIILAVIRIYKRRHRNPEHEPHLGVPLQDTVQGAQNS